MLFSGIDLHKRSLVIHTLDADGTTAREAELKSDRAAVMAYFGTLAGPHCAVVECVQSWYDVTRFPTVRHFHSYCRLVPGADNSAGKTRHKRSRDGNRYLKLVFHTAAIRRRSTTRRTGRSTGGSRGGRGRSWRGR